MIYLLAVPGPIEDVEDVRVLEWHGEPGRSFRSGELVVELETHKALVEVRAARPGVLRRIISAAGDWQGIGKPLALLSDLPDEDLSDWDQASSLLSVNFDIS